MRDDTAIFFDLDRTLWDFETNSKEALYEIFSEITFHNPPPQFERFFQEYKQINLIYWDKYKANQVTKEELRVGRFQETFRRFGYTDKEAIHFMAEEYVKRSPEKTALFPGSLEVLDKLKEENYRLFVITNGFEETQYRKLKNSGLTGYFSDVITSEIAGAKKPDKAIFRFAEKKAGVHSSGCSIIGDAYDADITGGKRAGWQTILFDPANTWRKTPSRSDYRITQLTEILRIFAPHSSVKT